MKHIVFLLMYLLAGGAFWKLGFDNESIWSVTAKYLNP